MHNAYSVSVFTQCCIILKKPCEAFCFCLFAYEILTERSGSLRYKCTEKFVLFSMVAYGGAVMGFYMKTTLIFLRHGQSIGNATRQLLGHTDLGLSELGYKQAEAAVELVKTKGIDAIYSSDLKRAYDTAVPSAQALGLEIRPTSDFREIYMGEWDGIYYQPLIDANDPLYCVEFRQRFGYFRAPGGESTEELGERIYRAAEKYARVNLGKTILIACHAAAIRMLCAKIMGLDKEQLSRDLPFPQNASLTTVEYDGEHFKVVKYSEETSKSENAW